MSIDWKRYLAAITGKLTCLLFPSNQHDISTREVSEERLEAAALLEALEFAPEHQAFVGAMGFLVVLRAGKQKHVVLHRRECRAQASQVVDAFSNKNSLPNIQFTDAHFFFLADALEIPLAADVESQDLAARLELQLSNNKYTVDFDKTRDCYGSFFAWELDDVKTESFFIELLLRSTSGELCLLTSKASTTYGLDRIQNLQSRLVNLDQLCATLFRPVAVATDTDVMSASISLKSVDQLVTALTAIGVRRQDIVFSVGGGACFEFSEGGRNFIALSLRNFYAFEIDLICHEMREIGADEPEMTDAHFLSFCFNLGEYLDLAPKYLAQPDAVVNELDVKAELETTLGDLRSVFEEIRIFDITEVAEFSPWKVLCHLAVNVRRARSAFIPFSISKVAARLIQLPNVPFENIYLSLSASHWKHSFLEIYRVIEGLYYFGWMHKLKSTLQTSLSEYALAVQCKDEAAWSYKETTSIVTLFEVVPRSVLSDCDPASIPCLAGRFEGKNEIEFMRSFASAIYSIRNSNVHQNEHATQQKIDVTANCWPKLTHCLFLIVEHLYAVHGAGMPPAAALSTLLPSIEDPMHSTTSNS